MQANRGCLKKKKNDEIYTYDHVGNPILRVISYASIGEERLKQIQIRYVIM